MLECVVNVSEGRDRSVVDALAAAAGHAVLDVHLDGDHHRSVFTLAGADVEAATRALTRVALARIDVGAPPGVHPRLGAVDVVPFVPLDGSSMADAIRARDDFARWASEELRLPCFLYGAERASLPEVRRRAFRELAPDLGPRVPHPTAGACCVGARPVLVAYNLWLAPGPASVGIARTLVRSLRSDAVRALALDLGAAGVQVSCNLIDPTRVGPDAVFDEVAARATVRRAEVVGLVPRAVVDRIPRRRWRELDVDPERTIEARLAASTR